MGEFPIGGEELSTLIRTSYHATSSRDYYSNHLFRVRALNWNHKQIGKESLNPLYRTMDAYLRKWQSLSSLTRRHNPSLVLCDLFLPASRSRPMRTARRSSSSPPSPCPTFSPCVRPLPSLTRRRPVGQSSLHGDEHHSGRHGGLHQHLPRLAPPAAAAALPLLRTPPLLQRRRLALRLPAARPAPALDGAGACRPHGRGGPVAHGADPLLPARAADHHARAAVRGRPTRASTCGRSRPSWAGCRTLPSASSSWAR